MERPGDEADSDTHGTPPSDDITMIDESPHSGAGSEMEVQVLEGSTVVSNQPCFESDEDALIAHNVVGILVALCSSRAYFDLRALYPGQCSSLLDLTV